MTLSIIGLFATLSINDAQRNSIEGGVRLC
jgi:hypothetical protein